MAISTMTSTLLITLILIFVLGTGLSEVWRLIQSKHLHLWLASYIKRRNSRPSQMSEPIHILFCLADHFEPAWGKCRLEVQLERVKQWCENYPRIALAHKDSNGHIPQHTFFFPEEEYAPETMSLLAELCKAGFGDVEIHLHHDKDTGESFKSKIMRFKTTLFDRHGLLRKDPLTGEITYGFIHGNWALDNSRKDGRFCGVNNEIVLLKETGCYADFTMPSAPSDTQSRTINSIYYVTDDPEKPKSYDVGVQAEVGRPPSGDLLMIQGPLALNWNRRKFSIFPRIENGDLCADHPPTPDRINLWIKQHIHVKGVPQWVVVKVYSHGAQDRNMAALLNGDLHRLYHYLETNYNDGRRYQLHYMAAWDLYNVVKAAEHGLKGNPSEYRGFLSKLRQSPNKPPSTGLHQRGAA